MKLGILGGGQLGQMMAQAAQPLGIEVSCFDSSPDACAQVSAELVVGDVSNTELLASWAETLDHLTYEFESFDIEFVSWLSEIAPVNPNVKALAITQDRWAEKGLFNDLEIAVPPFRTVKNEVELRAALRDLGYPCVAKTRRGGYDGKGQVVINNEAAIAPALAMIGEHGIIVENLINFDYELSIVGVRSSNGDVFTYAPATNVHINGILHASVIDPRIPSEVVDTARSHIAKVFKKLDYVGVGCIEFFVRNKTLLANEMAPRVHNSGHWTIEGAECSQFENHLRAVCNLPIGSVATTGPVAMINIIGTSPDPKALLEVPGAHVHLYGKEPRPGRKLGHVTIMGSDSAQLAERVQLVEDLLRR